VLTEPLLAAYRDAGSASDLALSAVASIAGNLKAPSRVLTTARAVAMTSPADPLPARNQPAAARPAPGRPHLVPPGPVERILLDLDVTNPADLAQAAAIDTAADQLILRTAHAARPPAPGQAPDLNRSSGTAELISGLLATSGDQAPAALRPQHATARHRPAATPSPPARVIMRARLAASLTAARKARAAVRHALSERGLDQLTGDAELLASELVANAAEHGDGKPIRLALYRQAGPGGQPGIRCEVTDTSPHLPRRRDPAPDRERGRGLAVVAALASASGVRTSRAGKTTWFTLTTAPGASRSSTRHTEAEPEAGA
jgi:anti-sigma regulatory factor (Ser/Thr protein kinase)